MAIPLPLIALTYYAAFLLRFAGEPSVKYLDVFLGSIVTTPAAPSGDGLLSVADGDTITATYVDADDGAGGFNVAKTDTALADCSGPVISNVLTSNTAGSSARVTWTTDVKADSLIVYEDTSPPAASSEADATTVTSQSRFIAFSALGGGRSRLACDS